MNDSEFGLKYQYGSIYDLTGKIIEHVAIVYDKKANCGLKYGSYDYIQKYYNDFIKKFREAGINDIVDDVIMIDFNPYRIELNNKEICTVVNYLFNSSGHNIEKLLSLNIDELKLKLKKLNEVYGY